MLNVAGKLNMVIMTIILNNTFAMNDVFMIGAMTMNTKLFYGFIDK